MSIDQLYFLSEAQVREIGARYTPVYVYSKTVLRRQAEQALSLQTPYGLTVRYAMKANPHPTILGLFDSLGIHIDASSGYEADAAIAAGIAPSNIQITSQELPKNLVELVKKGVGFTATSLHQLEEFGKLAVSSNVGIRINPGMGDGFNNRNNTGGVAASFGIWHEYIPEIQRIAKKYNLAIDLVHTHIGTGSNPAVWLEVAKTNLGFVEQFPTVSRTSLGGGFKVPYQDGDPNTKFAEIADPISALLERFAKKTGRQIQLEIEPGRFLVAEAGTILSEVIDVKDTGPGGHNFLVINAGMTEIIRPAMYGARHKLVVVNRNPKATAGTKQYGVSGHCCETGDSLTVKFHDPEVLKPRRLATAEIGDYLCIETAGAYCASFRASGYNSFPEAPEIFVD